jgi:hypothetical protein
MQHAIDEEADIPLQSIAVSIRNSMQHAIEEDAHIPLESLLLPITNAMQRPNHCLLGMQRNMLWRRRPTFHSNPY